MDKGKYWLSGILLMVVLSASVYFIFDDKARIDIGLTSSIFRVYENGEWVISGVEYVNLFDGSAKMRAKNRSLETIIGIDNITTVTRIANYKDGISTIEIYEFNPNVEDVELFPISHLIRVIKGEGKILQYEVQKLLYSGETVSNIKSPQSFGHKMKVEWEDGNYYSRIWKYANKDEGKLTVKYRVDSSDYSKNVRLFDPAEDIFITLNSPSDNSISEFSLITFNATATVTGGTTIKNMSLWTNETGSWGLRDTDNILTDNIIYDNFADSSINASKWTATGTGNSESNPYLITSNSAGQNQILTGQINSSNLPAYNTITYMKFNYSLYVYVYYTGSATSKVNVFGNDLVSLGLGNQGSGTSASLSEIGMVELYSNGTNFDWYLNGTYQATITPSNNILYIYSYGRGFSNDASNRGTATTKIKTVTYSSQESTGNMIINRTISDGIIWNVEACDSSGYCNFSLNNYTVDYDHYFPAVSIDYPNNIEYFENITQLNYTASDDYPDKCWYSNDSGVTNYSVQTFGDNFTIATNWGENTFIVFCNDTNNQISSDSVSFNKSLIGYAPNSDPHNISADFAIKNNIFVNVSLNSELDEQNITFTLWNTSLNLNTTTFLAGNRTINWINLPRGMYWYNVTVCDTSNVCNSTLNRNYGVQISNVSVNGFFPNQNVELGSNLSVIATSSYETIFVDINHPDYGINYVSGLYTTSFNLVIDYFRKTIFNDSSISKVLNYTGTQIKEIFFPSHQYDEVDSFSFNISGVNSPKNIQINNSNSSVIDRIFPGYLIGNNIYQNITYDSSTYKNLTYSNKGSQSIYFWMDRNSTLQNLKFNITGKEFGFDYADKFDNYSNIDNILTTAQLDPTGNIFAKNLSKSSYYYDNFDTSNINQTRWKITNTVGGTGTANAGTTESGGAAHIIATAQGAEGSSSYANAEISSKLINLYDADSVNFSVNYVGSYCYRHTPTPLDCNGYMRIYLNDSTILNLAKEASPTTGNDYARINGNLNFHMYRINKTYWAVEKYGSISYTNILAGSRTDYYTGNVTYIPSENPNIRFHSYAYGQDDYSASSTINIYNVTRVLTNRTNSTVISKSIYDASGDIAKATMWGVGGQGQGDNIWFYMSANNGENWEAVTSGLEHSFTYMGRNLKWKVDFNLSDTNKVIDASYLSSINVSIPKGFPSNISIDFGNDGIADWTRTAELNGSNSPVEVEINMSLVDLTSALSGTAYQGVNPGENYGNNLMRVPLKVTSSIGQIDVDKINLTYNPNPVFLNTTAIYTYLDNSSGYVNFPISVESINGNITINDIRFDYAGGNDTITILAHNGDYSVNQTLNITLYYSRWDYAWGPANVEWLYFAPSSPTSKNVTPYGQTSAIPIFNLTNYGYGGKNADLSIYQNDSLGCVSTFMSSNNTKPSSSLWNGLVSYWNFDFGANDSIGDNDGTVYGATQVDGDAQDGLVAWYKFDAEGDLQDYVGTDYATNHNASWNSSGKYSGAYKFNGTRFYNTTISAYQGDSVYINPKKLSTLSYADNFTISFFVNLERYSWPSSSQGILAWGFNGGFQTQSDSKLHFGTRNSTGGSSVREISTPVNLNQWYMVTGVYSNSTGNISLYFNDTFIGTTLADNFFNLSSTPNIGNSVYSGNTGSLNGRVDDLRIYDKYFNSNEVSALYERRLETLGNAYSFDGSDDKINITNNTNLRITDNISIAAWFKINQDNQLNTIIHVGQPDTLLDGVYRGYWLGIDNRTTTKIWWQIGNNSATRNTLNPTVSYDWNTWHHVVAIYNTSGQFLYMDGVIDASSDNYAGPINYTNIDVDNSDIGLLSSYKMNGSIDEVRIYNRSLTSGEISELYTRSVNKYYDVKLQEDWDLLGSNLPYLKETPIWMWADYNCSFSTWKLFEPQLYFRQVCEGCIASEDLV